MIRPEALLAVFTLLLLAACGKPQTPEAEIREQIARLAEAGEDEDIGTLADGISDGYQDLRGNDKRAVVTMMRGFALRTDKVLIFADIDEVSLITGDLAEAAVRVRFAGANLELFDIRTSVYRFVLEFERDGSNWRIVSARWAEGDGALR